MTQPTLAIPAKRPRHYPTSAAKCADLVVHIVGLTLALAGGIILLTLAVRVGSITRVVGVSIYAAGVIAMLAFSTAYNFAKARYRPLLRCKAAPTPDQIPDYAPPFGDHAVSADADGNIWIREAADTAVYDLVNRRGEMFDRRQIPGGTFIVAFDPA